MRRRRNLAKHFVENFHPKTLIEMWITCLDPVSANSEKDRDSGWAVRMGQRLPSRFGQSGAARELDLVQIVVEAPEIRGGLPSTQLSEPVFGWRCRNGLRGLWRGAAPPTAWTKTYANFSTQPVLDTPWSFISAFDRPKGELRVVTVGAKYGMRKCPERVTGVPRSVPSP